MTMHIYKLKRPDDYWWVCEIGVRRYKLTNITFWYISLLFWSMCIEIRKD